MKKVWSSIWVLLVTCVFTLGVSAQQSQEKASEKKAAAERQRSLGGQKNLHQPKANVNPQTSPDSAASEQGATQQPGHASNKGVVVPNKDQPNEANNPSVGASNPEKSNAPAVVQTTTSESGSPAVLSEGNGSGRDGTGNVQRSTMNIAGSPVPGNMNLDKKVGSEKNMNTQTSRVRKQEEQPAVDVSASEGKTPEGVATQPADQGRATIEPTDKNQTKKESRKEKRKNRRNKEKDSGK